MASTMLQTSLKSAESPLIDVMNSYFERNVILPKSKIAAYGWLKSDLSDLFIYLKASKKELQQARTIFRHILYDYYEAVRKDQDDIRYSGLHCHANTLASFGIRNEKSIDIAKQMLPKIWDHVTRSRLIAFINGDPILELKTGYENSPIVDEIISGVDSDAY
ncbi:MAG TPA: hypothetical protein DCL21_00420 [Alphaproteobacteria bacterium]|nr:hypothetical protein [Alphaproteobacteria bacterium]